MVGVGFCPCGVCDDCWRNAGCPEEWPRPTEPIDVGVIRGMNGVPLSEMCGPEFGDVLRRSGMRDAVCERCSGSYLTRTDGLVCPGCLTPDERRERGVGSLEEHAVTLTGAEDG